MAPDCGPAQILGLSLRGQAKKSILESRLSGPFASIAARMMEIIDP